MKCASVLIVTDFATLNQAYGLEYSFAQLARCGLSEPYYVLIAQGFDTIPPSVVERWRAEKIHIEDCSSMVASLRTDYPYLENLPDNITFRVTLLRHLILERYFPGEGVLSVDADIIWRIDPYRLFGRWTGDSFALDGSACLTYAGSSDWFDAYRAGLESLLTDGDLTADFADVRSGAAKILHDQHLIRHLEAKGLMRNAWEQCRAEPWLAGYWTCANPLMARTGLVGNPAPLTFACVEGVESFNGAAVPFWHMQTSFANLCSFFLIHDLIMQGRGGRLPFPRPRPGEDNFKAVLCHSLRNLILRDQTTEPRLARLKPGMLRLGVYDAFFDGDLAGKLFKDEVWWEPGVFA